jgi:polyisoprenoid-binding protein YceI
MIRVWAGHLALILMAVSVMADPIPDGTRNIVKAESRIEFHATATMAKVVGIFHAWKAELKTPGGKIDSGSLTLEIESESVETGNSLRDREVKSKNFFSAKEFPEIRFASKSIIPFGDPAKFRMEADLTLRGITQPVTASVTVHPPENGYQHIDADFSFNRRDFGMTHNLPFNKVANTVDVRIHLDAVSAPVLAGAN